MLETALVDLYHLDRAEQAAEFVPAHPVPQREQEIPQSITQDGRVFEVKTSPLRWSQDTPGMAINRLATLAEAAMPDRWLLVTYVERQRSSTYDPVIFAGYGGWYIKVAEWVSAPREGLRAEPVWVVPPALPAPFGGAGLS